MSATEPTIQKTILEVLNEADERQERRFTRMEEHFKVEFNEVKREIQKVNDTLRSQEIRQTKFESKQESDAKEVEEIKKRLDEDICVQLKSHDKAIGENTHIASIVKWVGLTVGGVILIAIAYGLISVMVVQ